MKPTEDKEARLTDEEIRACYNKCKYRPPKWIPEMDTAILYAQLVKLESLGYHKD